MLKLSIYLLLTLVSTLAAQEEHEAPSTVPLTQNEEVSDSIHSVMIQELKGVLLISSKADVQKSGVSEVAGFESKALMVPGGDRGIDAALGPLFIGQPLTQTKLIDLKKEVLLYYRSKGYPIVIVEIPEQNIKTGVVQLVVIESKLSNLRVTGNRWFSNSFYNNKFSRPIGEPIYSPQFLNDVAWLNQNPFQNAELIFSPGSSPETTDVNVLIDDSFPLRLYVGGDNTGNPTTENTRLFAGANWGYAFYMNHILSYQYSTSPDFKSFYAHTLNYLMLFPWKNSLSLFGGLSGVKPNFAGFQNSGQSCQLSMRYRIPFKPFYSSFSQEVAWGADFKRTNNNINFVPDENLEVIGSNVNLFQLLLQYTLSKSWDRNLYTFMIEGYGSPGQWLPDQSNQNYNQLRFQAKNVYFYSRVATSGLVYIPRDFSLKLYLRGQVSTTNLLPSEEMGVGGYDTVRGYEERILNLDNAVIFNFELRSPSFSVFSRRCKTKDQLSFLGFFDYGGGNDVKNEPGQQNWYQIYSVGPGARYNWGNYLSARFDWGFQLKSDPFNGQKNKVHLGLMLSY